MSEHLQPRSISDDVDGDARKRALARQLSSLSFMPASVDVPLSSPESVRLPLDMLPALGVGFASIPEAFRTITQMTGANNQPFRAVLPEGATLKQAADGLFSSSAQLADGTSAWGKIQMVDGATATIPYNPTTLAMAIAFAQINQKLDGIQSTLNEMFDYLRIKDKANARASLETLSTILNDYKFNWNNDQFKKSKYNLVQTINRDARQYIIELRAQIAAKQEKNAPIELRNQAEQATNEALDLFKEDRLAVYLYSFSTFLGVMLLENFDPGYLESKSAEIRKKAFEYRQAYTDCFNAIESRNRSSVDGFILGGVSFGLKGLGGLIANTPLGNATPIDEALIDAGSGIEGFDSNENNRIAERLTEAKDPMVGMFADGIESVNRTFNQPSQLLVDSEAIYMLPE